jgi:hypothetical protein
VRLAGRRQVDLHVSAADGLADDALHQARLRHARVRDQHDPVELETHQMVAQARQGARPGENGSDAGCLVAGFHAHGMLPDFPDSRVPSMMTIWS